LQLVTTQHAQLLNWYNAVRVYESVIGCLWYREGDFKKTTVFLIAPACQNTPMNARICRRKTGYTERARLLIPAATLRILF
jgi:hypothetical protein